MVQLDYVLSMPSPRLIKTHLWLNCFEDSLRKSGAKILVAIRNPKDLLVSLYHFYQLVYTLGPFTGSWEEFFDELFLKNQLLYGDYFDYYAAWWRYKTENPNQVLFVWFEDMKKDIRGVIRTIAEFLGKTLTEDQVEKIKRHTGFEAMKKNDSVNPAPQAPRETFFRKGEVGDWKNYFTQSQSDYVDKLVNEKLTPVGLQVQWE